MAHENTMAVNTHVQHSSTLFLKRMRYATIVPFLMVSVLVLVHILNAYFNLSWNALGVLPRTVIGIPGIITYSLLHSGWPHLVSNAIPLFTLGTLLFFFYPKISFKVFFGSALITGLWLWCMGRPAMHIGASGWVYALAMFLIASGLIRRNNRLIALSLIVIMFYGGLVWGVLPIDPTISWEGHLMGAFSGLMLAYVYRKQSSLEETEMINIQTSPGDEDFEWYEKAMDQIDPTRVPPIIPDSEIAQPQIPLVSSPFVIRYTYVERRDGQPR